MLDDGATRLLRPKTAGDILAALPRARINHPTLSIATIVQPPAQIGCCFGIQLPEPTHIPCATQELITAPQRIAPLGRSATDLPVVSDHIVAAILTHTGLLWMQSRLEMAKYHFCSQFRIGIAEEERIHRSFCQDCPWRLN